MKIFAHIATLGFMLAGSGCGTLLMRAAGPGEELYPATKGDIMMIHGCLWPDGTIFTQTSYLGVGLTLIDVPISLAMDTALLPLDLLRRYDLRQQQAERQLIQFELDNLVAVIRQDPQGVFDKKWHTSSDPLIARAVGISLHDGQTRYTAGMLERLMVESPQHKNHIFAHPLCPTHLLVENFQHAHDQSFHLSYEPLAAIVSNPNTPIELIEKVASSRDVPVGAVYPARDALKRRQKESLPKDQPVPAQHPD